MKKFLIKIAIFLTLLIPVYGVTCIIFNFLEAHAKGETGRQLYIHNRLNAGYLIMGSSRAEHHYNPAILTPYYNIGEDKMGIIFNLGRLELIRERAKIRSIIYDIEPDYDLLVQDPNSSYLGYLRPYYWHRHIKEIFRDVDGSEKYKMLFPFYAYNSRLLKLLADQKAKDMTLQKGYVPYEGCQEIVKERLPQDKHDPQKYAYMKRLINECKKSGTQLIFTASPQLSYESDSVFEPFKKICKAKHIPFLNHYCDKRYTRYRKLFHNANHLNSTGADLYTVEIAKEIKMIHQKQ